MNDVTGIKSSSKCIVFFKPVNSSLLGALFQTTFLVQLTILLVARYLTFNEDVLESNAEVLFYDVIHSLFER